MMLTGVRKRTVALLFVIISFQSVANAGTTNRQPPSINTSNRSQSATKTSVSRPMEPAFANAGRVPGIEIWRIENFKPVPYPKNEYGKFHSGDSYIILYTKENKGVFSWDIHFWLGSETSQDESGTAAILTVALDDQLGGVPVQHREVQEHESPLFLSNFKSGVRYLPGGVSSGFTHVDRNAVQKRLFHVKGKKNVRVKQVDLSIAAMNKGDCFILDAGNDIYVYVGAKSKHSERLKAITAANQIRDQDHGGRSKIRVLDEFSSETEITEFFNVLGSGSQGDVPDESSGGDDELFEDKEERSVALYRVSDSSGKMQLQQVGQKPLQQRLLDPNDCFILETGNANLYVWIGKQCNKKEKDEAMLKGQEFLKNKKYPIWTHVERVVQDGESSAFVQYFQSWQGARELHPRINRSTGTQLTSLEEKSEGELPDFMPDNASGKIEIYRIENFNLSPVDPKNYGKFFGGDSYIVKYLAKDDTRIIYVWQGKSSSTDEKASAALLALKMKNEFKEKSTQIQVVQDHEPKHFLHLFKGKLIVFLGGHASGFKNIKEHDTYVEGETRLFRVRGTNDENVRASQLKTSAKSLESDDVFIAEHGKKAWIWYGKDSDTIEKELSRSFVEQLAPGVNPEVIEENKEPEEFWKALGGRTDYQHHFKSRKPLVSEPSLFHAFVKPSNEVRFEKISNFDQYDLDSDDVMILDNTHEVLVWIGEKTDPEEPSMVLTHLPGLLRRNNRQYAAVVLVKEGDETALFTSSFPSWNTNLVKSDYETIKQQLHKER